MSSVTWTGTGVVEFERGAVSEVLTEWWGAEADGSTDCAAAFSAAVSARYACNSAGVGGTPIRSNDNRRKISASDALAATMPDDPDAIRPEFHVFTSTQVSWCDMADGLPRHAENAPEMEKLWAESDG